MTCASQMTATSPTPQQQNRWKGRRCLAAAFIPQPAAYPPETSVALFYLFHTFTPQEAPNKPPAVAGAENDFSDKLCQKKKIPANDKPVCLFFFPLQAQRRRFAGKLIQRSGSHIVRRGAKKLSAFMCTVWKVDSRSHSELQQQEATCSEPCVPSLCLSAHAVGFPRAATRRRQTQPMSSRWHVVDISTFPSCKLWFIKEKHCKVWRTPLQKNCMI